MNILQNEKQSEYGSENIDDDEEDEKVISKEKKDTIDNNKLLNRTNNDKYNFSYPSAKLEELPN